MEKRNLAPVTKMKPKSTTSDVHPNGFSVFIMPTTQCAKQRNFNANYWHTTTDPFGQTAKVRMQCYLQRCFPYKLNPAHIIRQFPSQIVINPWQDTWSPRRQGSPLRFTTHYFHENGGIKCQSITFRQPLNLLILNKIRVGLLNWDTCGWDKWNMHCFMRHNI